MASRLTDDEVANAEAAIKHAQSVRRLHRRTTDRANRARQNDIKVALQRLKSTMSPIRRYLSSCYYGPQTAVTMLRKDQISQLSKAMQAERRKLFKMQ